MYKQLVRRYLGEITTIPLILDVPYFPSLDGFRGLSILIVLVAHVNYSFKNSALFFIFEGGNLGVSIFFVISGFIITTLLLKEKVKTTQISLKRFYIRRFLRIFPVAYLFILVLLLLNAIFHLEIPAIAFIGAAFYLTNFKYLIPFVWYTAHFWSLAVEEQYYLIFPPILKMNTRIFCLLIPMLLVVTILIRWITALHPFNIPINSLNDFFSNIDAVLVGSLFSILCFKDMIPWKWIKKHKLLINIGFIIPIILLHKTANHFHSWAINHTVTAFLIGTIIISNIIPARDLIFRLLNSKLLVRLGLLSYSIYIWQSIFTVPTDMPPDHNLPRIVFPVNIILLFLVSYCSYYFYEKKFLMLKRRFKQV